MPNITINHKEIESPLYKQWSLITEKVVEQRLPLLIPHLSE